MPLEDPIADFKVRQRDSWSSFAPLEMLTIPSAARLVRFAGVKPGDNVLDVACGTGVVAITARRAGARVSALDLTPELLARAKEHAGVPGFEDVAWREGDAESLPYADGEFDVVLSQFGHMFAPRPEVVTREMLRVLRPGGTIAFTTWAHELGFARMFALVGKYSPPLPPGVPPSTQWGDVAIVRERLGGGVRDVSFDREDMLFPAMSLGHYRELMERTSGPVLKVAQSLRGDPKRLSRFRAEFEALAAPYFEADRNVVRHGYLMTRATKA